jgi:hypothetical protein
MITMHNNKLATHQCQLNWSILKIRQSTQYISGCEINQCIFTLANVPFPYLLCKELGTTTVNRLTSQLRPILISRQTYGRYDHFSFLNLALHTLFMTHNIHFEHKVSYTSRQNYTKYTVYISRQTLFECGHFVPRILIKYISRHKLVDRDHRALLTHISRYNYFLQNYAYLPIQNMHMSRNKSVTNDHFVLLKTAHDHFVTLTYPNFTQTYAFLPKHDIYINRHCRVTSDHFALLKGAENHKRISHTKRYNQILTIIRSKHTYISRQLSGRLDQRIPVNTVKNNIHTFTSRLLLGQMFLFALLKSYFLASFKRSDQVQLHPETYLNLSNKTYTSRQIDCRMYQFIPIKHSFKPTKGTHISRQFYSQMNQSALPYASDQLSTRTALLADTQLLLWLSTQPTKPTKPTKQNTNKIGGSGVCTNTP